MATPGGKVDKMVNIKEKMKDKMVNKMYGNDFQALW